MDVKKPLGGVAPPTSRLHCDTECWNVPKISEFRYKSRAIATMLQRQVFIVKIKRFKKVSNNFNHRTSYF